MKSNQRNCIHCAHNKKQARQTNKQKLATSGHPNCHVLRHSADSISLTLTAGDNKGAGTSYRPVNNLRQSLFLCLCLFVCLSVCLSVCVSVSLSVSLSCATMVLSLSRRVAFGCMPQARFRYNGVETGSSSNSMTIGTRKFQF